MILDTGICSVFRLSQKEVPSGYMPTMDWTLIGKSWYKELQFSTQPKWESANREETQTDQKIRIIFQLFKKKVCPDRNIVGTGH